MSSQSIRIRHVRFPFFLHLGRRAWDQWVIGVWIGPFGYWVTAPSSRIIVWHGPQTPRLALLGAALTATVLLAGPRAVNTAHAAVACRAAPIITLARRL